MNRPITNDNELAAYCGELAQASDEAGKWVDRNQDIVRNEKEGLKKELRKAERLFRNCQKASARKMCAGVFGPSQAGKSYLISALARGESSRLDALFGDEAYEFLSEINPEGGKESTGLVTRFTLDKIQSPPGYPVKLALLSETDIVKIIANAYYADCEHKEKAQSDIEKTLARLRPLANGENNGITLNDMEELREYLYADFRSKPRVIELENHYWDEAQELAPKLALKDRIRLYSLIWDDVEEMTDLLSTLLDALAAVKNSESIFCGIDALIPRDKSIIDVATLGLLTTPDKGDMLQIALPGGDKTALPRSIVAALTAELVISMAEKPADYFNYTDLLDFPGYRSRYKLDDCRKEMKKEGMLKELFLRGKVAYLFQRYCSRKELTSMLLCIGPSNQEVQDLPGVINSWISSTHGSTPESRQGKLTSLFFILTKFDMEFEDKKGAPSLEARWDNRLHASLLDFFGKQHDWPTAWTPGQGFRNIFLLRNPNFRFESIMDFNGDLETGVRPARQEYVTRLENAFLQSKTVKEHFTNPQKAWDEAMRLNDGGISYIRASLSPLCDPSIKRKQLLENVEQCRQTLTRRLSVFFQSDDHEELRKEKTKLIVSLFKNLGDLEIKRQRLGQLLRSFTISDADIYNLHSSAMHHFRNSLNSQAEKDESDELADLNVDDIDLSAFNPFDMEASKSNPKIPRMTGDEADAFASVIESKWVESLHALADDPAAQKYFMLQPTQFSALASELATGAERFGFRKKMADAFRQAEAYANTSRNVIIRREASIAGRIINEFIDWLGHHPDTESAEERTVQLPGGKIPKVFEPAPPIAGLPALPEMRSPYTQKWYQDWLYALAGLILDNINFDGSRTFNVQENSKLGAILKKLGSPMAA